MSVYMKRLMHLPATVPVDEDSMCHNVFGKTTTLSKLVDLHWRGSRFVPRAIHERQIR